MDFKKTGFRSNIQKYQEYTFVTLHPVEFLQAIHSARRWSIVTAQLRVQPRLHLRLSLPRIPSYRRGLSGWMRIATVSQRSVSRTGTTRYTCKKNCNRCTMIFPRWLHDTTPDRDGRSKWLVVSILLILDILSLH